MFERLREASDRHQRATGHRPKVFLANLGPVSDHTARAGFARHVLAAGGIDSVDVGGFDTPTEAADGFAVSGTEVAIICSSDTRYAEQATDTARLLKQAGARMVLLAGRPGDHEERGPDEDGDDETGWRDTGVDRFVFAGGDAHADLIAVLDALGVTS